MMCSSLTFLTLNSWLGSPVGECRCDTENPPPEDYFIVVLVCAALLSRCFLFYLTRFIWYLLLQLYLVKTFGFCIHQTGFHSAQHRHKTNGYVCPTSIWMRHAGFVLSEIVTCSRNREFILFSSAICKVVSRLPWKLCAVPPSLSRLSWCTSCTSSTQ
jgi:hypothetical protein